MPFRTVTPMAETPGNARQLAFVVLDRHKQTSTFATRLLDDELARSDLPSVERRLAREIVSGVVRRRATLNALLEPHVRRPRHKVEGALWTLAQMGAYQLVFLPSIPGRAAVYETVELAKWHGMPRWTGFLNGVLRAIDRNLTETYTDDPGAEAVPLTGGRYRVCRQAYFPDPQTETAGYFAGAFSFPEWLVNRWLPRFDASELFRLGFWFNTPPPISLRVNRLKTDRASMLESLEAAGVTARAGEHAQAIRLDGPARIEELPGFAEGRFTVQDESGMRAADLLAPQPGETVLDLCAAPGTKTTHLAERMENRGRIVAADIGAERLSMIEQNARRLGLTIVEPQLIRADGSDTPTGPFDAVLVDAPCSNTGVLHRRPEARWRLQPRDITELSALQRRLLTTACDCLKPGGRLVYATCSIEPEENAGVVQNVLAERSDVELLEAAELVPGRPADGGYQALLRRSV